MVEKSNIIYKSIFTKHCVNKTEFEISRKPLILLYKLRPSAFFVTPHTYIAFFIIYTTSF